MNVLFDQNKFLKIAEDIIIKNPIDEDKLIRIMELSGELSKYGFNVERRLQFILEKIKNIYH